jgi:hypothetical protein
VQSVSSGDGDGPVTVDLGTAARRAAARILLAAATLGFGVAAWFVAVHHRWQAIIGAALWAVIGVRAFMTIWNETDRSETS